ncbi:unnamed protein product [Rotaria sp. Silwood1]|nr:unnamed protein product [Rotaria sp. Silwood1]
MNILIFVVLVLVLVEHLILTHILALVKFIHMVVGYLFVYIVAEHLISSSKDVKNLQNKDNLTTQLRLTVDHDDDTNLNQEKGVIIVLDETETNTRMNLSHDREDEVHI